MQCIRGMLKEFRLLTINYLLLATNYLLLKKIMATEYYGINYFPLLTGFFHCDTIELITAIHGVKGPHAVIMLLCKIYTDGYYIHWGEDQCMIFARKLGPEYDKKTVEEIVNLLIEKRFFDKKSPDVKAFSTNYLINEFLDETDRAVFERMRLTNPRKYEVAGLGNWGISEGLVYENWTVGKKQIPKGEEYKWKSFFGLDYGYTNDPTGFVGFMANPIDKEMYIYCEFCKKRMLNCDIAAKIKEMGFSKERIRADCAEPKSNDDLRRLGIGRITPSVKGRDSILNGISAINEYRITVNPDCTDMIRELSSYVYEDRAGENGVKNPKDSNNHLCDAMRYAFEDVKHFHPQKEDEDKEEKRAAISGSDLTGGWDI